MSANAFGSACNNRNFTLHGISLRRNLAWLKSGLMPFL
jgi:hypothetical protein